MIVIIDYNINNLVSIYYSVKKIVDNVKISNSIKDIEIASKLILPGVGTYFEGMKNLENLGLINIIKKRVLEDKIPILGICLGMQLLSSMGNEVKTCLGLNLIEGRIDILKETTDLVLPHIGWNEINIVDNNNLLVKNIKNLSDVYFVHSYYFLPINKSYCVAKSSYSQEFISIIAKNNIYGVQFHPEKSGVVGIQLLKNFLNL